MKKINILLIFIVLLLAACNEASAQTTESSSSQEVSDTTVVESSIVTDNTSTDPTTEPEEDKTRTILSTDYENSASVQAQLLIGIYQLNGTDLAVTTNQASSLIDLLTTLKDSFSSQEPSQGKQEGNEEPSQDARENNPQDEIESIISEAVSVLSDEQISSIAAMQITQETVTTVMEALGITVEKPQNGQGNAPEGGMQQGNPPADGQQPQGNTPPTDGQSPQGAVAQGTPPADGGQMEAPGESGRGGGSFVSPELIEAIIEYLHGITS